MYTVNKRSGFLASVTGPDKSGKGTQWALLGYALARHGYDVVLITYPDYATIGGLMVEMALRRAEISRQLGKKFDVPREVLAQLYALDRTYHIHQIKNALNQGKVVITKRSTTMTHAPYQVGLFGMNFFDIYGIDSLHPKYDASIFLEVTDTETKKRNADFDKHDSDADYVPDENEQINQSPISYMQDFLHKFNILPVPHTYRMKADGPYENIFEKILKIFVPLLESYNIPKKDVPGSLIKIGLEEAPNLSQISKYIKDFNYETFLDLISYLPNEENAFGSQKNIVLVSDFYQLFPEETPVGKIKDKVNDIIQNSF